MLALLHNRWILVSVQLLVGLPLLLGLVYGVASLGRLVAEWLPILIYAWVMGQVLRALKRALWLEAELGFLSRGWSRLRGSLVLILITYPVMYALAFAMVARELHDVYGVGFSGSGSLWEWLGFGLDNLLEIVLADVPAIYELSLSGIEPDTFTARTLVLGFRLSLDLLLLVWVGKCMRHALVSPQERGSGTLSEA